MPELAQRRGEVGDHAHHTAVFVVEQFREQAAVTLADRRRRGAVLRADLGVRRAYEMTAPVGEEDDAPVAVDVRCVAVLPVRAARLLQTELAVVIALLPDDQLALHADTEVVARVAVRGREIGWARELFGRRRRVVEQAEQRTRNWIAHTEQHWLPGALAQWRFAKRKVERVGVEIHAKCCEHARDPTTGARIACHLMSEPDVPGMPGHFISDMGFTYQVDEGLARGWAMARTRTERARHRVPAPIRDAHLRRHRAGTALRVRDRAPHIADGRSPCPDPGRTAVRPDRDRGPSPEDRPHDHGGRDDVLRPGADRPSRSRSARSSVHRAPVDVRVTEPAYSAEVPKMLTLTQPFSERLGIRMRRPGVADADHRPDLLNTSDSIQGACWRWSPRWLRNRSRPPRRPAPSWSTTSTSATCGRRASVRAGAGATASSRRHARDRRDQDPRSR